MGKELELDYKIKHSQDFACPFCKSFLIPWSWNDKTIIYSCKCNGKDFPAWHTQMNPHPKVWLFLDKEEKGWGHPKEVPKSTKIFNPSVR